MRLMISAIISVCIALIGIGKAKKLQLRVREIEKTIHFLTFLFEQLKSSKKPLVLLFETISNIDAFRELDFIRFTSNYMSMGNSFEFSIKKSLEESKCLLNDEEKEIIFLLSKTLGSYITSVQLAAINTAKDSLAIRLETAKNEKNQYAEMYTTLGLTSGLGVFILTI